MRIFNYLLVGALVLVVGCGQKNQGNSGDSVNVKSAPQDGAFTLSSTDDKGNKVTEQVGNDGSLSIKSSDGQSVDIGTGGVTEADLGLPFYPGSAEQKAGTTKEVATTGTVVMSTRTMKDSADKVLAFYKDKIVKPSTTNMGSDGASTVILQGKLQDGADALITASSKQGQDTQVSIAVTHKK